MKTSRINELLEMEEIITNVENLYEIMKHLNNNNWGSWKLPNMSTSYTANQYNCDGVIATTIILDKPLKGIRKFQLGAPKGHLRRYTNIGRF